MSSISAFLGRSLVLLAILLQGACAQLPENVDRPVSTALPPSSGTPLEALVQQRRKTDAARFESGFLLLGGAPAAYGSRLALIEGAQKTLDLQYYAIHADASTGRLLRSIRSAAQRGVRVRILLDDLHSTGRDAMVLAMAFVPNIEMRLFNPLAGGRRSSFARMLNSAGDASRAAELSQRHAQIDDELLAALERQEELTAGR